MKEPTASLFPEESSKMKLESDDEIQAREQKLVLEYLGRIASAARALAREDDTSMDTTTTAAIANSNSVNDAQSYMDQIALDLLQACRLDVLTLPANHLPRQTPPPVDLTRDLPLDPSKIREWQRPDYLRQLLRAMAPIAMDVVAHICALVIPANGSSGGENATTSTISSQDATACFLLFSIWLPLGPSQMAPLVAGLFSTDSFPCPLQEEITNTTSMTENKLYRQFLLAQATHAICHFFHARGEMGVLLQWWNWSVPFLLLHQVTANDTNIGSQTKKNKGNDNQNSMDEDDDDDDDDDIMEVDGDDESMTDAHEEIDDNHNNEEEDNDNGKFDPNHFSYRDAIRWHVARVIGYVLELAPLAKGQYFQKLGVRKVRVPWVIHPWMMDQEEADMQELQIVGKTRIWDNDTTLDAPSAAQIRKFLAIHPWLVHVGSGIVFAKHDSIESSSSAVGNAVVAKQQQQRVEGEITVKEKASPPGYMRGTGKGSLTRTVTTAENLALVGAAMCTNPHPPILVCGPNGSGKSSLVRELAAMFSSTSDSGNFHHDQHLLEIHVDEETDAKTLVGTYTMTDIPGEFAWKPGALTLAVRSGKWVLIEDLDSVPIEIQASLVKLLEDRVLPLGMSGKMERCHPNFRLFATLSTASASASSGGDDSRKRRLGAGAGKRILSPSLWRKVFVKPLPHDELKQIARSLYPNLPQSISESALDILKAIDRSGREVNGEHVQSDNNNPSLQPAISLQMAGGRHPSVRDFFKLLSRIASGVVFERDAKYATESQRTLCMAETYDIFCAAIPHREQRRDFIRSTVAPTWGLTADLALAYIESRRPVTNAGTEYVEVGRAKLPVLASGSFNGPSSRASDFTETSFSLRLMESIAVAVKENEPLLLVGETGGGKTSVVQHLAKRCGRDLVVQNLSLQTDSTDLLGGFRPLELQYVAQRVYSSFVDIFVATFSRKQNADFLKFASSALSKKNWKKLSQCFLRAAKMGVAKVEQREQKGELKGKLSGRGDMPSWQMFSETAESFERQRLACDSGLVFCFSEGALVDAIREGQWVLLDEINLASSEILQRLLGLLDDEAGSLTLTERGDVVPVPRHPDFRLFAAMNPATDAGKKELHPSIRSRFTELYVDELLDPVELRVVSSRYLRFVLPGGDKPPEHTEVVVASVNLYLKCRDLAEQVLVDGAGHKPRFTLRTLARAMTAAQNLVSMQRISLQRALVEGFELAIQGPLDANSIKTVQRVLKVAFGEKIGKSEKDHPGRRPGKGGSSVEHILIKPFWIQAGPLKPIDWAEPDASGRSKFILTPSAKSNVRRLARAIAAGPWPVLLEGPTSGGKTTLVEYIAARLGHHVVRINNHEHTDVQEYTGSFAPDSNGSLSFQDGILVRALKRGDWVILDELNLAPSEVLEALNRLLDDNRQLYLAEINQTIKPHPSFRLFATQNPCGAYGGRKQLSKAFRNRFVELHVADIPNEEMTTILERRCACPPSHAKVLVAIMDALRQRRSRSGVFLGKDGLITPRDLLRWAERQASSKLQLAQDGYMLLAERLRTEEEKKIVKDEIERQMKLSLNVDELYFGQKSPARMILDSFAEEQATQNMSEIASTRSLLRSLNLILRSVENREPILLVGDTGCGKTTVVELLSMLSKANLRIINCHATTETSDLIGGLRPVRGRKLIAEKMYECLKRAIRHWPDKDAIKELVLPPFLGLDVSALETGQGDEDCLSSDLPDGAVSTMIKFARELKLTLQQDGDEEIGIESPQKKPRLSSGHRPGEGMRDEIQLSLVPIFDELEELFRRHSSLFEWADGPVAAAMKAGDMLLLDELSLAEDAVLERLNSVLEPSRTLVLAEKGEDPNVDLDSDSRIVHADDAFRIFATMNPGGDFGKRELSPALRSRFTEIWVPPVDDKGDVALVLARCLATADTEVHASEIPQKMLDYVEWFNQAICKNPSSPYPGLCLSLRDVLSWAHFMIKAREANRDICVWEAYCHGAALMHLDGLGLGTGLSLQETAHINVCARDFLMKQLDREVKAFSIDGSKLHFTTEGSLFGLHPFWIQTGKHFVGKSSFDFKAPKTAENVHRVLRAMQLTKPILLEGDPGVGKTSLVLALANAAGHRLTRINLSEQTDMSDLIGCDLPVPEKSSDGKLQAAFKWCDGVLLTAIKNGDWVLLDELNLAPQSVLEGLNSCLDYRANIFVAELGKTFQCPPTFRVFAAQNPMGQGGGRKGLPRSFLNRFTKVHVAPLGGNDLRAIVGSNYKSLATELVDSMIDFNQRVHRAVVDERHFGSAGSPWEFNLRDVFRWSDLLASEQIQDDPILLAKFASFIYLQRFRTQKDRQRLRSMYTDIFQYDVDSKHANIQLDVSDDVVRIGCATLPRIQSPKAMHVDPFRREPTVYQSLAEPLEAVARCVQMKWPCLLVGKAGSGKSIVLDGLAELCNADLIQVSLSPSSEVNELVGCFEQGDVMAQDHHILTNLRHIASAYSFEFANEDGFSHEVCQLLFELNKYIDSQSHQEKLLSRDHALRSIAASLVKTLTQAAVGRGKFYAKHSEDLTEATNYITRDCLVPPGDSHFQWVDGVLARAMTEGSWLLLENVNLCPSSVLDRLNPVMEIGGELLMAECGIQEQENTALQHRVVKPHPNFRIFLAMDPANGEISRAMRNRCIEIALLSPESLLFRESETQREIIPYGAPYIDCLDLSWSAGLRSSRLAENILRSYGKTIKEAYSMGAEPPCIKVLNGAAKFASTLLAQGLTYDDSVTFLRGVFPLEALEALTDRWSKASHLLPTPSFRGTQLEHPRFGKVDREGRLLRQFLGWVRQLPAPTDLFPNAATLLALAPCEESLRAEYDNMHQPSVEPADSLVLRNYLLFLFLLQSHPDDFRNVISLLDGHADAFSASVRSMADLFLAERAKLHPACVTENLKPITPSDLSSHKNGTCSSLTRLPQRLVERVWYKRMDSIQLQHPPLNSLSVLDVSFLFQKGAVDQATSICRVTPAILPLFQSFDLWADLVFGRLVESNKQDSDVWRLFHEALTQRDRLWALLADRTFSANRKSLLPMDEADFIVQWTWFKKSLNAFESAGAHLLSDSQIAAERQLNSFIDTIDSIVFGHQANSRHASPSIWRKICHPLVPCSASQWDAICRLRKLASSCCFDEAGNDTLELRHLVGSRHPFLVFHKKDKIELLQAICMLHWSSTDEAAGEIRRVAASSFASVEASLAFQEQWKAKREEFFYRLDSVRIDQRIDTVENLLGVEDLQRVNIDAKSVKAAGAGFGRISEGVLYDFGQLQLASCATSFCMIEEMALIRGICRAVLESSSVQEMSASLAKLADRAQMFITEAVSRTTWPVSELRPYQTFVWASKEPNLMESGGFERLISHLLPVMFSVAFKHSVEVSSLKSRSVDASLEMPVLFDSDFNGDEGRSSSVGKMDPEGGQISHAWVATKEVFNLLGKFFSAPGVGGQQVTYSTLENHRARGFQARDFAQMLSTSSFRENELNPFEVNHIVAETFFALKKWLVLDASTKSLTKSSIHRLLKSGNVDKLRELALACKHTTFQGLLISVVEPLLSTLSHSWDAGNKFDLTNRKNLSLAKVYAGLLRFHLLLPESPVDPGRKPQAKVTLLGSHLSQVRTQVTASQLSQGYKFGDFSPDDSFAQALIHKGSKLAHKIASQEKKIVERVQQAPPFVELYRESRGFADNFCRTETILKLVDFIQTSGTGQSEPEKARDRSQNWQDNVAAFCDRLVSYFGDYEDVISPLLDAVRLLHEGIRSLVDVCLPRSTNLPKQSDTLKLCLSFPIGNFCDGADDFCETLESVRTASQGGVRCHRTLGLAFLSRLAIHKLSQGLNNRTTRLCSSIFDSLIDPDLQSSTETIDLGSSEEEERSFREQFPDFFAEFQSLLARDEDQAEVDGEEDEAIADADQTDTCEPMPADYLEHLCFIHRQLFSDDDVVTDADRSWAFVCSMKAANHLVNSFGYPLLTEEGSVGSAAHVMALSLAAPSNKPYFQTERNFGDAGTAPGHFYSDPNPSEVLRAAEALENLSCRITQLLTAFPGNDILLGVFKVADSVRKLDLHTSSVGRVMTGLEVVLKQSQDWEQHASERVLIGKPLSDISHLVAMWRKLELESWKTLLSSREDRFHKRARKHWARIFQVLRSRLPIHNSDSNGQGFESEREPWDKKNFQWSPRWTWKGMTRSASNLFDTLLNSDSDLLELAKVMDTFVLTSPLGEFSERLLLLRSFSNQLLQEAEGSGSLSIDHKQHARLISSLLQYYNQFLPVVSTKIEEQRAPIESKLRDQMKLAKWDEQSYYALADSSEKNHRNLMRCLREYDGVLNLNVGQLIDRELCGGIRSDSSLQDEQGSFTVPRHESFFPLLKHGKKETNGGASKTVPYIQREWSDPSSFQFQADAYVGHMERYASKMKAMILKESPDQKTWSIVGRSIANEFCDDIFHRIESLRGEKSSRQMKERALVDLFKTLKHHGYSNTKWSVPKEQKQMVHVFQVPSPSRSSTDDLEGYNGCIQEFEQYYLRFLAELTRFRSETEAIGSKYMSRRETEIMLNFSEHGLLMITQQRALLSSILLDFGSLKSRMDSLAIDKVILHSQRTAKKRWRDAGDKYVSAIESLGELKLLLKLVEPLLSDDMQKRWAKETAAALASHILELGQINTITPGLLTTGDLEHAKTKHQAIEKAMTTCAICQDQNHVLGCLPKEAVNGCYYQLKEAATALDDCMETPKFHEDQNDGQADDLSNTISEAIKATLLSVQETQKFAESSSAGDAGLEKEDVEGEEDGEVALWACHKNASKEWANINIKSLNKVLDDVLAKADIAASAPAMVRLLSDLGALCQMASVLFEDRLQCFTHFCRDTAKFHYILVRIFRVLVSKGYCSDDTGSDNGDGDGANATTFEDDKDGTGMGEGEGAQDVTDQLESEEQLLGLEGDDKNDQGVDKEQQQLDEEQAETGMEMEAQFDGDMFDMPDKPENNDDDKSDDDKDETEELDREMGLDEDPNEQVVDEKLWGDSDDENDVDQEKEKFEKNSSMKGEQEEDQLRTKDDDEGPTKDKQEEKQEEKASTEQQKPDAGDDVENDNTSDNELNEDLEDNYEDSHGIDVREEPKNDEAQNEQDEPMELDDNLQLEDENPNGNDEADVAENDAPEEEEQNDDNASGGGEDLEEADNTPEDNEDDGAQVGNATTAPETDEQDNVDEDKDQDDPDQEKPPVELPSQPANEQPGLGIRADDGQDACQDTGMEDEPEETAGDHKNEEVETGGDGEAENQQMSQAGANGGESGQERGEDGEAPEENRAVNEVPNPFKNPGDATKFWHEKLNMLDSQSPEEEMDTGNNAPEDQEKSSGEFEYAPNQQDGISQVLGEVAEDEAVELEQQAKRDRQNEGENNNEKQEEVKQKRSESQLERRPKSGKSEAKVQKTDDLQKEDENEADNNDKGSEGNSSEEENPHEQADVDNAEIDSMEDEQETGNRVISDLSQLEIEESDPMNLRAGGAFVEDEQVSGISSGEILESRKKWSQIQGDTHNLALRLCEKLRLVMEPLVASKLRGDYRTGKRINMKRVIGYIASGYRKDKIWLRRTKPSKRNYRVLLAVDDSESMLKCGTGEIALRAMATLAMGMSQLEIGELGVASFGDDMKLLHPFDQPFTSESGINVVQNFGFDQPRTRTALCVESALSVLDSSSGASVQLMFLISDGRIERDSRAALRRLIREMMERNILLAMIIVEPGQQKPDGKKSDSIVNMKEVTFEKGKPKVKRFIEDYPFPYYLILDDIQALPEVLGDALRQWFEMLAQIQESR